MMKERKMCLGERAECVATSALGSGNSSLREWYLKGDLKDEKNSENSIPWERKASVI